MTYLTSSTGLDVRLFFFIRLGFHGDVHKRRGIAGQTPAFAEWSVESPPRVNPFGWTSRCKQMARAFIDIVSGTISTAKGHGVYDQVTPPLNH